MKVELCSFSQIQIHPGHGRVSQFHVKFKATFLHSPADTNWTDGTMGTIGNSKEPDMPIPRPLLVHLLPIQWTTGNRNLKFSKLKAIQAAKEAKKLSRHLRLQWLLQLPQRWCLSRIAKPAKVSAPQLVGKH